MKNKVGRLFAANVNLGSLPKVEDDKIQILTALFNFSLCTLLEHLLLLTFNLSTLHLYTNYLYFLHIRLKNICLLRLFFKNVEKITNCVKSKILLIKEDPFEFSCSGGNYEVIWLTIQLII